MPQLKQLLASTPLRHNKLRVGFIHGLTIICKVLQIAHLSALRYGDRLLALDWLGACADVLDECDRDAHVKPWSISNKFHRMHNLLIDSPSVSSSTNQCSLTANSIPLRAPYSGNFLTHNSKAV